MHASISVLITLSRGLLPVAFLCGALLCTSVSFATQLRVVIDPGHGGADRGAVRNEGGSLVQESIIALDIARELKALTDADTRFQTLLTRTKDQSLSLEERAEFAENNKADVFLSIHANASDSPRARGVEIYFQNQMIADDESIYLASRENAAADKQQATQPIREPGSALNAQSDVKQILDDLRHNHKLNLSLELSRDLLEFWPEPESGAKHAHSIRQAPFFVISQTSMPSALVEVGFVSNSSEGALLTRSSYQKEIASDLYKALVKFKETIDKERTASLH